MQNIAYWAGPQIRQINLQQEDINIYFIKPPTVPQKTFELHNNSIYYFAQ